MKPVVLASTIALALLYTPVVRAQLDEFAPKEELTRRVEKLEAEVGRLRSELNRLTQLADEQVPDEQAASALPPLISTRLQHERSPAEVQNARIVAQLTSPTEIEFSGSQLPDVADYLSELHNIRILLDPRIIADGIDEVFLPDIDVSDITLGSALDLMLRPHGLDYIIDDEVLKITTAEIAEQHRETRVYDVRQFGDIAAEELARVIRRTVQPMSWREEPREVRGDSGARVAVRIDQSRTAAIEPLGPFLVITQSQRGHREIEQLLVNLKELIATKTSERTSDSAGTASVDRGEIITP